MQLGHNFLVEDYEDLTDWCVRAPVTQFRCLYSRAADAWYLRGLNPRWNSEWIDAVEQCQLFCVCEFEEDSANFRNGGHTTV
jgi:hypothetical protein